jgi:hypothetical protein
MTDNEYKHNAEIYQVATDSDAWHAHWRKSKEIEENNKKCYEMLREQAKKANSWRWLEELVISLTPCIVFTLIIIAWMIYLK